MTKGVLGAACALGMLCVAGVAAQSRSSQPQRAADTNREYVALGCVARSPAAAGRGSASGQGFMLTDERGAKPTVYYLDGDQEMLTFHMGHTVEVAGALSAAPAPSGNDGSAYTMKVRSLIYISRTCQPFK